ncbi:hypothetical protein CVP04_02165 [Caviibacterium pharyngocola]|uniref:Uncharacterized protein n=2 Tax=Caviibacterium pharyngocola TaxID=28159 RepID=A0A2M8RYE7_9PAST|nr:hypothetical protein CVP04_02165 [Caviibacterium pharyngocola]
MILTEEKKQQILASLKQDYVPFSDVFHEICADTLADMIMTGSLDTEEGQNDHHQLSHLKHAYFNLVPERYVEVLPTVEQVLQLQDKYQKRRFG